MTTTAAKKTAAKKAPAKKTAAKRAPAKKATPRAVKPVEPVEDIDNLDEMTEEEQRRADLLLGNDRRESPSPDLLDEVDEDLRFSTDSGSRREPDKMLIAIDDTPCYLYQPSNTLMILMAAAFTPNSDATEKVGAMMNLVNASLDPQGRALVRRMTFAADGSYDDALMGKLAFKILERWAPQLAETADMETGPKQNRAQRRRASRK